MPSDRTTQALCISSVSTNLPNSSSISHHLLLTATWTKSAQIAKTAPKNALRVVSLLTTVDYVKTHCARHVIHTQVVTMMAA